MGRSARYPLRDPFEIVKQKARIYVYRKRYLQVIVFSTWVTEVRILRYTFGGNFYKHGSGYAWLLSKRDSLTELVRKMEPHLPSEAGFENLIREHYMQEETPR